MSSSEARDHTLTPRLNEFLTKSDIEYAGKFFKLQESSKLSYIDFRSFLNRFNLTYHDDDFLNLCLKMDPNRDNFITWKEFVSYLFLELQIDDNAQDALSTTLPIAQPANIFLSKNRSDILRIHFIDNNFVFASTDSHGIYVTIGCFGDICFWSLKWRMKSIIFADEVPETELPIIELSDKKLIKKSSKTLILDAVILTDLKIICISSVCCDLRFYDCSTINKCILRLYVRNFPYLISALHYHKPIDNKRNAQLIIGDFNGTVRVIDFMKNFELDFRTGSILRQLSHSELMKNIHGTMKCREFVRTHQDVVTQVSFIESVNSFISSAQNILSKSSYAPSVVIQSLSDIHSHSNPQVVFRMNGGTTCFDFHQPSKMLATGGPDFVLRLWDYHMPKKMKASMVGHNSGIQSIFFQDSATKLYSMDKNKIVNVWDVKQARLLQTFQDLTKTFTKNVSVSAFYNEDFREFIVASRRIAYFKCQPKIDLNKTDGFTDMSPISLILFNKLFGFLVTCSKSSSIIIWDVWRGRKVNLILEAHTRLKHNEVDITAGCFDPTQLFLLTAGSDGTLKVWDMKSSELLRCLTVDERVVSVFWLEERIIVVSLKDITELIDLSSMKEKISFGKCWRKCHHGEIKCATVHDLKILVTSCTSGDIIFWNSEMGQPYMRFNVKDPTQQLPAVYKKIFLKSDVHVKQNTRKQKTKQNKTLKNFEERLDFNLAQDSSPLMVQRLLFLLNRPSHFTNGTILAALSNGKIQVWSHHNRREPFITEFDTNCMNGDVITALATDTQNRYLFAGSHFGYIKTWMISNFWYVVDCILSSTINGEIFTSNQVNPKLLNCYQGHKKPITNLIFSDRNEIMISSSYDKSVRFWNLSGQYIGTIGSPMKWTNLSANKGVPPDFNYRIPSDLRSVEIDDFDIESQSQVSNIPRESSEPKTDATGNLQFHDLVQKALHTENEKNEKSHQRSEKPTLDFSLAYKQH
ncbi:CLUMA_CG004768, isoform A [Clunio marinus]|uniref:WD repeat-containing protein on Y chromosome n=1 Tax=Clunio marinus TaxID=568069 RepID=A0A1J1HSN1_9DIPT|nr:CLUMA_CG004768, isoform A [Clunio marinus]